MTKKRFMTVGLYVLGLFAFVTVASQFVRIEKNVTNAAVSDWQQGASVLSKYPDDFRSDSFKQSIRDLKATGANSVSLIIPYYQSNKSSSDIGPAGNAPSDAALIDAINYIHSQGMQVMFKPHLEAGGEAWRAMIDPSDRDAWFRNYGNMLNHLGDIGKQTGTEYICIGTELVTTATYTSNGDNTQRWIGMINDLRSHFNGKLTYSANWGGPGFTDEAHHIGFWSNLDAIGISAYYNLYANSNDYNSLKNAWDTYRTRDIEPLYNQYKKPILFTEIGYRSISGSHNDPWNYGRDAAYDGQEQANDYEALFRYWDNYPYMQGVQLWNWDSNPNAGGEGNKEFTPQNKPAEGIMAKWFGGSSTGGNTGGGNTGGNNGGDGGNTTPGKWNASASAQPNGVGQSIAVPVRVTAPSQTNNVIVDVEIYNQNGAQVFQKYFEGQTLSSVASQYTVNFTPSQQGTYSVKLGVFNSNWSSNLFWNNSVLSFNVTATDGGNTGGGNTGGGNNGDGNTGGNTGSKVPAVNTLSAQVNGTSATIQGTVNMNGGKGTVWFEYSDRTGTWPFKAGVRGVNGSNTNTLTVTLNNLKPHTTYYYRIMAENYDGTYSKKVAQTVTFTTQ